jgi:hypothetical protein
MIMLHLFHVSEAGFVGLKRTRDLIVSVDTCAVPRKESTRIATKFEAAYGIPPAS